MALPVPLTIADAIRRLREAEDDHNRDRRRFYAGVADAALDADLARWERLGEAIAGLAAMVASHCANSDFCAARPDVGLLAVRLSESFDDLMDEPAWSVVVAATRLAASRRVSPP